MEIKRIWKVYFSPCKGTEGVVSRMAEKFREKLHVLVESFDYTLPLAREQKKAFEKEDLVIWGTPVYAGRIPNKTLSYIQSSFRGNGCLAIPVAVFGNRSYGDCLIELRNELEKNEFHTVAGAAVVARHCFSRTLAAGRPDGEDIKKMDEYVCRVLKKIQGLSEPPKPIRVAGNNPPGPYYTPKGEDGRPAYFLKALPKVEETKCARCGICPTVCPMGTVKMEKTDSVPEMAGVCIKCQACVIRCPENAIYFDDEAFLSHKRMLEKNFARRREPEFFVD